MVDVLKKSGDDSRRGQRFNSPAQVEKNRVNHLRSERRGKSHNGLVSDIEGRGKNTICNVLPFLEVTNKCR